MSSEHRLLWNVLDPPKGVAVRWFAKRGDEIKGGITESAFGLSRICSNLYPMNLYVGVNSSLKRTGIRVGAADINFWQRVVVDVDPDGPAADPEDAAVTAREWMDSFMGYKTDPTVIYSGRGCQLWFNLAEALELKSGETRLGIRAAVGQLLQLMSHDLAVFSGCRVDTSCSDLPRVARVPGTVNWKTKERARFITAGGREPSRFPLKIMEIETPPPPPRGGKPPAEGNWFRRFCHLTNTARDFILEGRQEPGRHQAAYAAAASLRDIGATERDAIGAVLHGAKLCSPELAPRDALRCVRNAYKSALDTQTEREYLRAYGSFLDS